MQSIMQWILVVVIIFAVIWYLRANISEGFDSYGINVKDYGTLSREKYIELGKRRYNRLSDGRDEYRPGMTMDLTPSQLKGLNDKIKQAIVTTDLIPSSDAEASTKLGKTSTYVGEAVADQSPILQEAKKCEAVKTRNACSILGMPEYANCGVCIKGGTDAFKKSPESHIGGMLVLKEDREMAEQLATGRNGTPQYQPTVGSCPEGYLFVDKAVCEKEVNRLNCKEAGESGGFGAGRTIEGKDVIPTSCANCQSAGSDVFIYEPKTRDFTIRVRAITPTGTGRNWIRIYGYSMNARKENILLGSWQGLGGEEAVITLNSNVKEGQELRFQIIQEFPHRPRGKTEVFYIDRTGFESKNDTEMAQNKRKIGWEWAYERYGYTKNTAPFACSNIGAQQATQADLAESYQQGAQICMNGFAKDGTFILNQAYRQGCGYAGLTNQGDLQFAGSFCKGIKPPVGTYTFPNLFSSYIGPFFDSYGKDSNPSQEFQPTQGSQYGPDYQAPFYHGIIMQWEIATGDPKRRRAAVEPSITSVMGQSPSSVASDGFKTFRILRRQGTFASSQMIVGPRPTNFSNILPSQYWLWSNQRTNPEFVFTAKIPGVFANPYYIEDNARCPRGPIVAEKSTLDLLKVSPCLKDGQQPGNYSVDCLVTLFRSAGGDPHMGKMSPLSSAANQRKMMYGEGSSPLDQDEILQMLMNYYSIASTGRDSTGTPVGGGDSAKRRQIINDAGQALFGIDIVTPCEEISEDAQGNIILVQKTGPFDAECLDYLYMNAGNEKSRGQETRDRSSTIGATYISIGDRFSGIKKAFDFGVKDRDVKQFPFQTCQRTGSIAPIGKDGRSNPIAVQHANASGGTIKAVQDFYNTIFTNANKTLGELPTDDARTEKNNAIGMCYGIEKIDELREATGCGVMARYVRVLRSANNIGDSNAPYMQISQIQVFGPRGNEYAKGKPTYSFTAHWQTQTSNAVDGNAQPRPHPQIFHDNADNNNYEKEYWMVDLGNVFEVQKVVYFNRTDCCSGRAIGMPIQLLDADKKVVAQKVLTTVARDQLKETVEFSKTDTISPVSLGSVVPGMLIRFETPVELNRYFTANGGTMIYNPKNDIDSDSMNFIVRRAMNGLEGAISFESVSSPGRYIVMNQPSNPAGIFSDRLFVSTPDSSSFGAASWFIRPALNGAPGFCSFESAEYSGVFMVMRRGNTGVYARRGIPDELDRFLACWRIHRVTTNSATTVNTSQGNQRYKMTSPGYDEGVSECFTEAITLQTAKDKCAANPRCLSFSFSKDASINGGEGWGCFKTSHDGYNPNPDYNGFTKI